MNFTFLNEPVQRWVLMIVILLAITTAWNGILKEMF